jgi:hypothetical protein
MWFILFFREAVMASFLKCSAERGIRCHAFSQALALLTVVVLTASPLPAFDIVPFHAKNQSPLLQIYGLPAAGNALLLPPGRKEVDLTLDHSSNDVYEQEAGEKILLDGETTRLTLGGQYGLSGGLEWGIDIPYISHSGGFLDGFIINYHDWFGFPQGGREQAPRNRLLYRYSRDGAEKLRIDRSGGGLGDVSLSAGFQLYHDGQKNPRSVALRANLKLPSGDSAMLYGSGSTDASLWIAASDDYPFPLGHGTVFGAAGLMAMTRGNILPEQQSDHVFFGRIGMGWNPLEWLAFKIQMDAHTPFFKDSVLPPLSTNAAQLLIGGALRFSGSTTLDIAVSEDIPTRTSPDMGFHFTLSTRF